MRYPGGKWSLAPWIVSLMPAHKIYVELFGGAASVLLVKNRSQGEIYNDLDSDVVNVFRVLRDPEKAARLQELLRLTPFSYEEYLHAHERTGDIVEDVRRMIFRSYAGIGSDSIHRKHAGFRGLKGEKAGGLTAASDWIGVPESISVFVERFRGVSLENRTALHVISLYDRPDTLFYADPPYLMSTRSSRSVKYSQEMTDEDHIALHDALCKIKGMAMVSGYPSELYDKLYSGWTMFEHNGRCANGKKRTEVIWLSPNIKAGLF